MAVRVNRCWGRPIIRRGRVVETGTLAELRAHAQVTVRATLARVPDGLGRTPALHDLRVDALGAMTASVDHDDVATVLAELLPLGVSDLTVTPASLDELFRRHYTDETDDEAGAR